MQSTASEATRNGILTTLGATIGLALGPSVIANLTVTGYITPIEQEFGWLRSDVSFAFSLVAYMIVAMSPLLGMLVDRFGPRRVVLTSIPLFALSLAAIYFTPANIYVYYLLWAIVPVAAIGQPFSSASCVSLTVAAPDQPRATFGGSALSGSEALSPRIATRAPDTAIAPSAKPSLRVTFTSAPNFPVSSASTSRSHSTLPMCRLPLRTAWARPFHTVPETPASVMP